MRKKCYFCVYLRVAGNAAKVYIQNRKVLEKVKKISQLFYGYTKYIYLCAMIITNKDILEKYSQKHVIVRNPLEKWITEVVSAQWTSFNDLRISFPSADYAGNGRVIFDIKGNDYRLIVIVLYVINVVEIRWIGTHAEYDKIKNCSII